MYLKLKNSFAYFILILALSAGISCQSSDANSENPNDENTETQSDSLRIVSLSGFLTELLYTLDAGDQIVGVDVTSTYPQEVNELDKLGHISQLNAEGILSLHPDVIFVQADQLQQSEALNQLRNSSIEIVAVPVSHTLHNSVTAAKTISEYVNIDPRSLQELETQITSDSIALQEYLKDKTNHPSVLFIYARGGGNLMVAGQNTSAQAIIEKAGGKNAITAFEQFRGLSPEALIESSPEVILMFDSGLKSLDGKEGLGAIPGISQTSAYKNDRIITMNGHYLTSFGPRSGQAALELAQKIYSSSTEM